MTSNCSRITGFCKNGCNNWKRRAAAHAAIEERRNELQARGRLSLAKQVPAGSTEEFYTLEDVFLKFVGMASFA